MGGGVVGGGGGLEPGGEGALGVVGEDHGEGDGVVGDEVGKMGAGLVQVVEEGEFLEELFAGSGVFVGGV